MKKLEDYEWICPAPFASLATNASGKFRVCCAIINDEKSSAYTIENSSYSQFYNSEFMQNFRTAFKENNKEFLEPYCKTCILQENSGNKSARQIYLNKFYSQFKELKRPLEEIIHTNKEPDFFYSIELNGLNGNICNLVCNMCAENKSSALFQEKLKLNEPISYPVRIINGKISPLMKAKQSSEFAKELPAIINKAREIKFVGGEPLLTREIYDVMRMCDNKKDTNILLTTNGTIDAHKFAEEAKDFRHVSVNISIEGVGAVNDYIRYPSDWNTILKTYLMLRKTTNFSVLFTTTINALNINRLTEVALKFPPKTYAFSSYVMNNCYSLNSIPPDIKEIFFEQLNAKKHLYQVENLISYLETSVYNENDMIEMIQHIKRRDKLRGTNLIEVFPEWKKYYEQY